MRKLLLRFAKYLMYIFWEETLNNELKVVWENGLTVEHIEIPMCFKESIKAALPVDSVNVYESDFGMIPLKYTSFVVAKESVRGLE